MGEIITALSGSNIGLVAIGFGLGIAAIVYGGLKLGQPLLDMREDVIQIKAQINGQTSMANTVANHERRICLAEQAQQETREDVREIKADVKDIYGMLNIRHVNNALLEERRGNCP